MLAVKTTRNRFIVRIKRYFACAVRRLALILLSAVVLAVLYLAGYVYRPFHYLLTATTGLLAMCVMLSFLDIEWPFVEKSNSKDFSEVAVCAFVLFACSTTLAILISQGVEELLRKIGFEETSGIGLFAIGLVAVRRMTGRQTRKDESKKDDTINFMICSHLKEVSRDTIIGLSITSWLVFTFSPSDILIPFFWSLAAFPKPESEQVIYIAAALFLLLDFWMARQSTRKQFDVVVSQQEELSSSVAL
jgi:hypothetical protein